MNGSMKSKGALLALYAIGAAASMGRNHDFDVLDDAAKSFVPPPIEPGKEALGKVCPIGAKIYWFNSSGEFDNDRMLKTECVFVCHAINNKNEIRKYKKFMKTPNK